MRDLRRLPPVAWLLAVAAFLVVGVASAQSLPNPMCPVLPEEQSDEEFHTVYKGRDVYFCCSTCVADFKKNPDKWLAELPQFADLEDEEKKARAELGAAAKAADEAGASKEPGRTNATTRVLGIVWPAFAVTLPVFLWWQFLRRRQKRFWRTAAGHFVVYALAGTTFVAVVTTRDARRQMRLWIERDRVHFATFYDFGSPPKPERPDLPVALAGTYYRGNDERNPRLFNNGYYRTATFRLAIVDGEGHPIVDGDQVRGKELFVRYEIERAPFTPDRFFSDRAMKIIFLTKDGHPRLGANEPVADRVDLTAVTPGQKWQAHFPIGKIPERPSADVDLQKATAEELAKVPGVGSVAARWLVEYRAYNGGRIRGTADITAAGIEAGPRQALSALLDDRVVTGLVYVAQTIHEKQDPSRVAGARFHYGIRYELHLERGVVTPRSDLWMNFLYRSRKIARSLIPDVEWFSINPIPELLGKNTDDPMLLGLDEVEEAPAE